jgi:homocysteine S-methyltransferase
VISYFNQNEQIRAIGVNCTAPENIIKALHNIVPYTKKKIIVYPNAGDTYDPISKRWVTDHGPINWSELVPTWYEAGACLIGGCCRTSPDDIYEINKAVQQLKNRTANI